MIRTTVLIAALVVCCVAVPFSQQRPDFSGGWTAVKDAPPNRTAAPTPVFGAKFWLEQKGDRLTVIRPVRDTAVVAVHSIDGLAVKSRVPGAMCMPDSTTVTSVSWSGNALVYRILPTMVAANTAAASGVPLTLKQVSPDSLVVEGAMRVAGQTEPQTVATLYRRMTDPPPAPPATIAVKAAPATLDRLTWLAGFWAGSLGTSALEERWTPAAGGSMLATSRTIRNSVMTEFEYLCIAERAGSLVYTAMPNGRTPATDFMLTSIGDTSATFENPAHDFPKTIRYALRADGTLDATISGAPGERAITYTFKKQ